MKHTINKHSIVESIIQALSHEVENLAQAAKTAHADATNAESKAENKYDTRGLEASYLAGAQAKRAAEAMQSVAFYKALELKTFTQDDAVALTAVVALEAEDGKQSWYFLGATGGGTEIEHQGIKILLITPSSPLGSTLMGREVGDSITTRVGDIKKNYDIIALY